MPPHMLPRPDEIYELHCFPNENTTSVMPCCRMCNGRGVGGWGLGGLKGHKPFMSDNRKHCLAVFGTATHGAHAIVFTGFLGGLNRTISILAMLLSDAIYKL